eukprot:5383523-Pleurochrysis_carterae.AAC.3
MKRKDKSKRRYVSLRLLLCQKHEDLKFEHAPQFTFQIYLYGVPACELQFEPARLHAPTSPPAASPPVLPPPVLPPAPPRRQIARSVSSWPLRAPSMARRSASSAEGTTPLDSSAPGAVLNAGAGDE